MFRSIPMSNKLCFDQDLKRSWKIHEQKLRNLKGSVGKEKPQQYPFLYYRLKQNALVELKSLEIGRQNKVLVQKMKDIQTKRCKNSYIKDCGGSFSKRKTLNQPFRKRELMKIVEENREIMKRLHQKKSAFNIKKMKEDRIQIQKNISLISQFPYKNYRCKNTLVNLWMTQDNFKPKQSLDKHQKENLSFTAAKKIDNKYYLITTYLKLKKFYIQIQNIQQKNQKYRMEMEQNQIRNLLISSYHDNFEEMIDNLEIDSNNQSCYLKYSMRNNSC